MDSSNRVVLVKNTFLEVGDSKSLLQRSQRERWGRQTSEPAKVVTSSLGLTNAHAESALWARFEGGRDFSVRKDEIPSEEEDDFGRQEELCEGGMVFDQHQGSSEDHAEEELSEDGGVSRPSSRKATADIAWHRNLSCVSASSEFMGNDWNRWLASSSVGGCCCGCGGGCGCTGFTGQGSSTNAGFGCGLGGHGAAQFGSSFGGSNSGGTRHAAPCHCGGFNASQYGSSQGPVPQNGCRMSQLWNEVEEPPQGLGGGPQRRSVNWNFPRGELASSPQARRLTPPRPDLRPQQQLSPWTDVTTVMMRNLPNKYTQAMLLEDLMDHDFRLPSEIDFLYLPMDHNNAANLGYCFINFTSVALANACAAVFQGKKMRRFNSLKLVDVVPASIQGFERNYAYYSSTRVVMAEDPAYRPIFERSMRDEMTPSCSSTLVPQHSKASSTMVKGGGLGVGGGGGGGKKGQKGAGRGGKKKGKEPVLTLSSTVDNSQPWLSGDYGGCGRAGCGGLYRCGASDNPFAPEGNGVGGSPWASSTLSAYREVDAISQGPESSQYQGPESGHFQVCPKCGDTSPVDPRHKFCAVCGHFQGQRPVYSITQ